MTQRQGAFTIIEFLVAVGLLGIVMLGVASSFGVQQSTYVVVDQVAEAKQNVRVVADLLEREIRNSGYMVPNTAAACGVDDNVGPDTLYLTDYSRIVSISNLPASSLNLPLGAVLTGASANGVGAGTQTVTVEATDLDGLGGGNDFTVGGGIIVADRNGALSGVTCGKITNIGIAVPGSTPLQVEMEDATGPLPAGGELVAIPAIVYEVVGNQLVRNGIPIVDQVEDFQVAWFFDLDDDKLVDPGEYIADGIGGTDAYDSVALDGTLLRELRINLVIRTRDDVISA